MALGYQKSHISGLQFCSHFIIPKGISCLLWQAKKERKCEEPASCHVRELYAWKEHFIYFRFHILPFFFPASQEHWDSWQNFKDFQTKLNLKFNIKVKNTTAPQTGMSGSDYFEDMILLLPLFTHKSVLSCSCINLWRQTAWRFVFKYVFLNEFSLKVHITKKCFNTNSAF